MVSLNKDLLYLSTPKGIYGHSSIQELEKEIPTVYEAAFLEDYE